MPCRFELQIKRSKWFHCAAKFGPSGWAYLWAHDDLHDPCDNCPIKIDGKPIIIAGELKSTDFPIVAGKHIRRKDWIEIERRGYAITINGLTKRVYE